MFNRLEVIMLTNRQTNKQTNKQTLLKTSTSLRYATPVGKITVPPFSQNMAKIDVIRRDIVDRL